MPVEPSIPSPRRKTELLAQDSSEPEGFCQNRALTGAKGPHKEPVVPCTGGVQCHILCVLLGSENVHFQRSWERNNSSAEICLKYCARGFHRELCAVDPRWYIHNSCSTECTQTLSGDIKESCLTLKIKLISCQDFTRACVTANDMLKPCKKKINMSNAKAISFCASLNYAHL